MDEKDKPEHGDWVVEFVPLEELGSYSLIPFQFLGSFAKHATHWHPIDRPPFEVLFKAGI